MIIPQDMIFQSSKFWPRILVPRGNIQNSKKICEISEITYHMKEQKIMMLIAQRLGLPDDDSLRYDFPKCEILTSNFGP